MAARKLLPTFNVLSYFGTDAKDFIKGGYVSDAMYADAKRIMQNMFIHIAPTEDGLKQGYYTEDDRRTIVKIYEAITAIYNVVVSAGSDFEEIRLDEDNTNHLINLIHDLHSADYLPLMESMLINTIIHENPSKEDVILMYWHYKVMKKILVDFSIN